MKKNERKKAVAGEQASKPEIAGGSRIVSYLIIFVLGFLAGVAFTVMKSDNPTPVAQPQLNQAGTENQQAILNLEAEVTAHPENFEAWTRLGHLYYDSNQPQKAVQAYTKSLELHTGDANLLTDLGVMYRRIKQPEKAIETFDRARKMDPTHLPSRYNKGIVLLYDLHDTAGAIASWEELLQINPEAKNSAGQPISEMVRELKKQLDEKPGSGTY